MELKEVVKEKYGQAALRVQHGRKLLLRGGGGARWLLRPDHLQSL